MVLKIMKKKLETIWIIAAWIMLLPLVLIFKLFKLDNGSRIQQDKFMKTKEDVLTKVEQKKLIELGRKIKLDLECNANGTGMPCRTCRFAALDLMQEYLRVNI